MEINVSSLSVFYLSKCLALAPISIQQNDKGVLKIRRSKSFTIYSLVLGTTLVTLAYEGLIYDANAELPLRMKSPTSKVVTALDITVVVLSCVAGIGCSLFSVKPTQELNSRLRKFDGTIHCLCNTKRDRIISRIMAIMPVTLSGALIGFDIWTWVLQAELDAKDAKNNVKWYLPLYGLYFILIAFHVLFANTAFGLGRRFRRLNTMLKTNYLADQTHFGLLMNRVHSIKITSDQAMSLHASLDNLNTDIFSKEAFVKTRIVLLRSIADNYESLSKCVQIFSNAYGVAILCILVSCLLHLVVTAYFLFLALLNRDVTGHVWSQAFWILLHVIRLLLVVEPCHSTMAESKKTIQIVSEIERKSHEPILAEEIKKFWQQLLVIDVEFSALGLCRINRNILTSFSSAIATYLVILIQFQNNGG
ncbi:gustatory receptor for sugar taste 43a-like [Eurosta solidaginis]|uniref:gustatory receptor for sugar taste 43a-like n=1 Tax=Eurosta solidaginis TaxID=178769 RepID=UPI0035314503